MLANLRLPVLFCLLLLVGCRAGGPETPARTVSSFFSKYEKRSGFQATDWSAGFAQRFLLAKAAKLTGGSDLAAGITGIRSARFITFAPTTAAARNLAARGLRDEATGVLQNENYQPLSVAGFGGSGYQLATRGTGDNITEFAAIGTVPDVADSFVLANVQGNFTRAQVEALSKYLPQLMQTSAK